MENKNIIISNYAIEVVSAGMAAQNAATRLGENLEVNLATLRTLNALMDGIRAATVNLQNAIDGYSE